MQDRILRLLDANFNRAREALRVLEDFARFILDDRSLSAAAKDLRHDLRAGLAQLPQDLLLAARDTPGDVGTSITTSAETTRPDAQAVVVAAGKRLSEALRCLEEYSKIDSPPIAALIEALRYRAYDLEKTILTRGARNKRFDPVRLYVLVTEQYCQLPILETCQAVLDGGADCIQLREKHKSDAQIIDLAREIAPLCRQAGALFVINDRVDLAVVSGADGVHLGQGDLSVSQARALLAPHMIVGKSTHNLHEARDAGTEQPDYIAFGAVFASPTKPDVPQAGPAGLARVAQCCDCPVIAIGGIDPENAPQAINAGAAGIALCQAVIASSDPESVCRDIKQRIAVIGRDQPQS